HGRRKVDFVRLPGHFQETVHRRSFESITLRGDLTHMNGIVGELRHNWGWILTFGILAIIWGLFAITYSVFFTVVSVLVLALLLILGGVIEAVQSIRHREGGHLALHLIEAALAIVAGILVLREPVTAAVVITLLVAAYFIVVGVFRIVASLMSRIPGSGWGWTL